MSLTLGQGAVVVVVVVVAVVVVIAVVIVVVGDYLTSAYAFERICAGRAHEKLVRGS